MTKRKKYIILTPLERAIRDFRSQCLPETNKARMTKIENCLTTVYNFKSIEDPSDEQYRKYYIASQILFSA